MLDLIIYYKDLIYSIHLNFNQFKVKHSLYII
jgi:hypothetical protein